MQPPHQLEPSPVFYNLHETVIPVRCIAPEDCAMVLKIAGYDHTVLPRCLAELAKRDFDVPAHYVVHWESNLPDTEIYSDMYLQLHGPVRWHQKMPGLLINRIVQVNGAWLLGSFPDRKDVRTPYVPAVNPVRLSAGFPLTLEE